MTDQAERRPSGDGKLLSICIPTLNRGAFIGATLDALIAQATAEVELVVVDGGSTDDTAAAVEARRAAFPALTYVRGEPVPGLRSSSGGFDRDCDRAVGFASGTHCWLMTDDDLPRPGALARILDAIRRGFDLVIVNSEVRSADLTREIQPRRMNLDRDREYGPADGDRFLVDVGHYLSFVGGVVIRRDTWMARDRKRYIGTAFIHMGMIFQRPFNLRALAMAEPLITIRYGNAQWTSRSFQILMFDWPALIWSFSDFGEEARAHVVAREPWRQIGNLLRHRVAGSYGPEQYRRWIEPRLRLRAHRALARAIAYAPGRPLNIAACLALDLAGISLAAEDARGSPFAVRWLPRLPAVLR